MTVNQSVIAEDDVNLWRARNTSVAFGAQQKGSAGPLQMLTPS